jgi:sulfur-oxidizing protein SoxY
MWTTVRDLLFPDQNPVFDDRVRVHSAPRVEDQMAVPLWITVDPSLGPIDQLVIFADHNPIPRILTYHPVDALPVIGLSFKVQEATPIRAAARTTDGVWHVGGLWLDAAGGGCTTPSAAQISRAWETHLNEVTSRRWLGEDGSQRLRFTLVHPMDTGLVDAIPAFYLSDLTVTDQQGKVLATLNPAEPVAENPLFTLVFPAGTDLGPWRLDGRDTDGNEVHAILPASSKKGT